MKKFLFCCVALLTGGWLQAALIRVPDGTTEVSVAFAAQKEPVSIEFRWADGKKKKIIVVAEDYSYLVNSNSGYRCQMPEAGFRFKGLDIFDFVRPNAALYKTEQRKTLLEEWDKLPPVYGKKYTLRAKNTQDGTEFYINGNYAGCHKTENSVLREIESALPETSFAFSKAAPDDRYLCLEISYKKHPGKLLNPLVELKDHSVPFIQPDGNNLDLGVTAEQQNLYPNSYGDSGQTGRNAFDNAEASFLFTIPMKQYSTAWILCACENDPSKYPTFTARLTRYVPSGQMGGRAYSAIGDVRCEVSEKGAVKVGTVTVEGETLPLWRVEARLDLGKVIDLITDPFRTWGRGAFKMHYLDFELMGWNPLYRTPFGDPRVYPDPSKPSAVHVFGVTLERSPMDVRFLQTTLSRNMFDDTMKPEMGFEYTLNRPGNYALEWVIHDGFGNKAGKGVEILTGDKGAKTIDLSQKDLGWYQVVFQVVDQETRQVFIEHTASYTLMGKDTRRAGYESPYIGWTHGYAHYGDGDVDFNGLRCKMLGVRRLTGLRSQSRAKKLVEKDYEKYLLTEFNAVGHFSGTSKRTDDQIREELKEVQEKWPHTIYVPLFWENTSPYGPYEQAPELYGESVPPRSEEWQKKADERWEVVLRCQRILKDFPNLRVLLGNSLTSTELIAETLRRKPPQGLIYALGTEAIQRTAHPEKPLIPFTMMYSRQMIDVAKMLGYDLKVTCGPENIARKADTIGLYRHAEWLVRDMLVQHVFGFETIAGANAGGGVGNCYDASFYAGGPSRAPYYYPNPSASATGTLTKVLDCVEFREMIPTGSNTVYCAEFYRAYDKKFIYAIWTSRGSAELTVKTGTRQLEQVGFHGKSQTLSSWLKSIRLTASTAAQYLLADARIRSVSMGKRTYNDEDLMDSRFQIVDAVDSASKWKKVEQAEPLIEGKKENRFHKTRKLASRSELREVIDPEKGRCLELSIDSDRSLNPQFSEYMIIRPEEPILIEGEANTIGLWVKGNSGWGQIFWELEDAAGVRRISASTPIYGNVLDYEGRLSINFDSWCFLSVQITARSPIRELSTGDVRNIWSGPMSEPKMPVKLTGIVFCAPAHPLCLNEYKECDQTIRIRDAAVIRSGTRTAE